MSTGAKRTEAESPWRTHEWAAARLDVHRETLRRWMRLSEDSSVPPAWIRVGQQIRWHAGRIDHWAEEVFAWIASRSEEASTHSVPEHRTDADRVTRLPRYGEREGSNRKSKKPTHEEKSGSLGSLARRLTSAG